MAETVEHPPTLEEWRALYDAAVRVKELAPWEWMMEDDIFGVQSPDTDELGFVSVMGMAGEHFAVAVYRGAAGLYGFWSVSSAGPFGEPEKILEVAQLQVSFENRSELEDDDRAVIKQLGLKFRGRNEWPLFRSYRPGRVPWFLESDEARFLTLVLEQTIDVASRFEAEETLLDPQTDESYLVRVPHESDTGLVWEDRVMEILPPAPSNLTLSIDADILDALKAEGQRVKQVLEIDFRMMPTPVQDEPGSRPYFPYLLLVVVSGEGLIAGMEMFQPLPSLEDMWSDVPGVVIEQLYNANIFPKEILVRSDLLFQLLQPVAHELNFKIKLVRALPSLDPAVDSLLNHLM